MYDGIFKKFLKDGVVLARKLLLNMYVELLILALILLGVYVICKG